MVIDDGGNGIQVAEDDGEEQDHQDKADEEGITVQIRWGTGRFVVSRKAVEKYGPTEGCAVCTNI